MSLIAFDADLSPRTRQSEQPLGPVITETVTVTPLPSESRTHLLADAGAWGWSELRDYVVSEIEKRFGAFPRDQKKEYGIFSRFAREHGPHAALIARHAFEVCDGWWANAPISVNRFCKGSDPYFALPIKERLMDIGQIVR